jgi:hypothetical protein
MISSDDRSVILATASGMLELDATTGKRTATGCGWHFGLADDAPALTPFATSFATPTICEDAEDEP